jgi:hypothetical protein
VKTTLYVEQANCSICFGETLDGLRRIDGVRAVYGSIAGPCIEIAVRNEPRPSLDDVVR